MKASAPLFANELLSRTAEIAGAGICGRRDARGRNGARKAGILAVHRLRIAIDLTREGRRVQTRRDEGHGRRGLIGLGEKLGCERCAAQQHEGRQPKSYHGILRFIFWPRGSTAPLWLIALAVISQAPTMSRFAVLSRRASAVAHRSALAEFTAHSPLGIRNRALPRRWRRTKRSAIRADCCPGWRCRQGWRRDRR